MQCLDAVDGDQDVGDDGRERASRHLGDEDLVGQLLAVRGDLTAAAHARGALRHRLESPAVTGDGVTAGGQEERDGLQTALGHEGAGHARVVVKVTVEVPVVPAHGRLGPEIAATPRPAGRIEDRDLVEQTQPPRSDARGAHVGAGRLPAGTEAHVGTPAAEGSDRVGVEGGARAADSRRIQRRVRRRADGGRVPEDAARIGEFVVVEEPRLAVPHGEQQRVPGVAVVLEEEQPDRAVHDVPGDADLEGERLAGRRWRGVKGDIAAEQAVDPLAAVAQVRPQPADQQQVGLARFDDQAGGHAARGVEVPGVGPHVGLGPDPALAERARRGVDPDHPVGEQQGRSRHPGLADVGVLDGEHRAEQIGEPARGEVLELGAVEARARVPGRRRCDDRRDRRCGG